MSTERTWFDEYSANIPIGMFVTTPSGRFLSANPALAAMLGYASPDELIGTENVAASIYKDAGDRDRIISSSREGKKWVKHPGIVCRRKDGTEIFVDITGHAVLSSSGVMDHFEGFVEDQTGRKIAEDALKAREESYRYLFLNAPSAIYEIDFHGPRFKSVNEAMCRISGYSREELLATNPLAFLDPDSRQSFQDRIRRGLAGLPIDDKVEYRGIRRDGSEIWFVINIAFTFEAGRVMGALVMAHDITEMKRSEKAIKMANRQLSLLNEITRHDMRNQLAVLSGYTSLLEKARTDDDRARMLEKVHHAIVLLQGQIDFTKQFQDIGTHEPTWQDLHALVHKAKAHLSQHDLVIREAGTNVEIKADPLFEKVVFNLIENVVRHGGARHLNITAEEKGSLLLIFEDDGRGISDEDREHLFERGYGKNTGFGLFLSREMLSMTDMTISETSGPGEGARFEIGVPQGSFRMPGKG